MGGWKKINRKKLWKLRYLMRYELADIFKVDISNICRSLTRMGVHTGSGQRLGMWSEIEQREKEKK